MDDKILIGTILKPQGILGELKIKDLSDGFDSVCDIKTVEIDGSEYKVLNIRAFSNSLFLSLSGIYDRNTAEAFRGKSVYAKRSEINKADDEFFIVDVLGCKLCLSSGKELGEILDISSAKVDIYTISTPEGKAVFPMLKELNPIFDIENKRVTVDCKRFTEVVMYED